MRSISIALKRSGESVQILLECGGEYHAMEVYDRLVDAAKRGDITIELKTRSAPAPKIH